MSDLIDRQAAIDAILHITNCKSVRELFEYNQAHHLTEMWGGGVNDAIDAVIGVESATDKNVGTTDTINRQQAIDAVTDELDVIDHVPQWVFDRLEKRLKQLPPAQPEIIRCKDCKWYGRADKRRFYRGMDCLQKRIDTIVPDKDFCSRAERRTDE